MWGLVEGLQIGLPPLLHFASKELQQRVAPECLQGRKVICLCISEPYAGSDVAALRTSAVKDGKGNYIVNGEKKWITNGMFADFFTVAVRTGGEGGKGLSFLLLEAGMAGIGRKQMECSGVWASGTAFITFDNVVVPASNLIGVENEGFKARFWSHSAAAALTLPLALTVHHAQLQSRCVSAAARSPRSFLL